LAAAASGSALYRLPITRVPNFKSHFRLLFRTKGSIEVRDKYSWFATKPLFTVKCYQRFVNPQAGGPLLVGCTLLFIQYICSYPKYWWPFLHPQPEDAPCRCDRNTQTHARTHTHTHTHIYIIFFLSCVFTFIQESLLRLPLRPRFVYIFILLPFFFTYLFPFYWLPYTTTLTYLLSPFIFSYPFLLSFNFVSSFLYFVSLYISSYVPSIVSFSLNLLFFDFHFVLI